LQPGEKFAALRIIAKKLRTGRNTKILRKLPAN
jgi:hypothetical protein